jgi:transposase-like protein
VKNKYLKHARISEREFRSILELFCADVEALKASRLAKVNKNTTHRIYGLLRRRVVELANAEAAPFAGCVEVDESYFGPRRVRGIRGRGAARKIPVVGLLKRGGRVICSPLPNCSKAELLKMIKGHVSPVNESIIFTDGWRGYDGLVLEGYKHYRVHHSANEFARGRRHINGIESFWSYAKTRLARLRGIRSGAFFSHLKETEWRFNHRHDNLYQTLLKNLASSPLI